MHKPVFMDTLAGSALFWRNPFPRRVLFIAVGILFLSQPLQAEKEDRGPKSPEAKVRVTGNAKVIAYAPNGEIVLQTEGAKGHRLKFAIPKGNWPHLGSMFFEIIFLPPKGYAEDFPVHSPMRAETLPVGAEVWYALEGLTADTLQIYQIAYRHSSETIGQFNAVVRNAVKLREQRKQEEIARDYQCRLIEAPRNPGNYPDDPALLNKFVLPEAIFADRLDIKAPPAGHKGYGRGLKSSDVYTNGVGATERRVEAK